MIELNDAKDHLKIERDVANEDSLIESLIGAALLSLEHGTGQTIRSREMTLAVDAWSPKIKLPWWPIQSLESVKYLSVDGAEQTLSGCYLNLRQSPAVLTPPPGTVWPAHKCLSEAITITAKVGYEELPRDLTHAALLLVGHFYLNREAVVTGTIATALPMTVEFLIQPYRIFKV